MKPLPPQRSLQRLPLRLSLPPQPPRLTPLRQQPLPAGTVGWYIGKEIVGAGTPVAVPVTVQGDQGTAGFTVAFDYDSALTFEGITWADGYIGEATINNNELVVVWADAAGADQIAADNAVVLYLNFIAPSAAGQYPVTFNSLEIVNTDGNPLTVYQENGWVQVDETTTTTESTTTETTTTTTISDETTTTTSGETTTTTSGETTTTTTAETTTTPVIPPDSGHAVYQIDDVNGLAGTTVDVPVFVWYDEGTAGFTMQFAVEEGFEIVGMTWGDAYTNNDEATWNQTDAVLVWASNTAEEQIAVSGAIICTLQIAVPADAEEEIRYPVTFVEGSIAVSDTDGNELEFSTVDGSIYILKVPVDDPGNVVYNIDEVTGYAGQNVELPLNVWYDDGTAAYSMTIDLPDGFTFEGIEYGAEYAANGSFTWDAATGTLAWTSTDGMNYVATPGQTIAVVTVGIPADAVAGTVYPATLIDVTPTDENGNALGFTVNDGSITIIEETTTTTTTTTSADTTTTTTAGETTTTTVVTSYSTSYQAPTRVNYWSHDTRTFAESGGLTGLTASITVYEYYVNANNQVVDADGNVLTATFNPASGELVGATPEQAFAENTYDVTAFTHPAEDADSPIEVYVPGTHKYPISCYYYPDEDSTNNLMFDEPIYFGDFGIYIGLKGDTDLNEKVNASDATLTLCYYISITVLGQDFYELNEDAELQDLAFYVSDVDYTQSLTASDATYILKFYTWNTVIGQQVGWESDSIVGFDFPDAWYE